jgi:glycopeptide antibiotics resistance protein
MKTWWQSKTVWLGIVTILIAALTQFTTLIESQDVKNAILGVIGLLNVILRVFSTSESIESPSTVRRWEGKD